MKTIGNILWVIFGGGLTALGWFLYGILWSITIIGIPLGKQCFKLARLSFMPFDKKVVDADDGVFGTFANIIWAITTGIPMALENLLTGALLYITIIGIPFAKQYFKMARLSLAPFGIKIEKI